MNKKILSYLGICQKSGNLLSGEFAVETAVKSKSAVLVILAVDASRNTRKKFTNKCSFYDISIITAEADKTELGNAIGREMRSVLAITDKNMAEYLIRAFTE